MLTTYFAPRSHDNNQGFLWGEEKERRGSNVVSSGFVDKLKEVLISPP